METNVKSDSHNELSSSWRKSSRGISLNLFSPVEMEVLGVVEVTGFKETKK